MAKLEFSRLKLGTKAICVYIMLLSFCMIFVVGCAPLTPPTVKIISNPVGAKFSIFDKKGHEIPSKQNIEITLDREYREMMQTKRFPLYFLGSDDNHHQFRGYSFDASGKISVLILSDWYQVNIKGEEIYNANGNVVGKVTNRTTHNVTPGEIIWENNYDYVKFEMAGYPTQVVKPSKSVNLQTELPTMKVGNIFADLTKVTSSNTSSQRNTTSSSMPVLQSGGPSIDIVLSEAIQDATIGVPKNSTIAVIPISTADGSLSDFLTGETEYNLVRLGFSVVDRAQLDRIRIEQRLQLSGEIDTNTISSIGKFSGADVIITGRIDSSGSLQRLRLQVSDVQTADAIGTASKEFSLAQPMTNPIGIEEAIRIAIENATTNISRNSRLAIVDIITENDVKAFITGESEYMLRTKGFRIVDRAQLDRVRVEQSIQHSNEFDNRTVANVGKLAGADYLITIRVDGKGSLTRLRWRILNTQTAMVIGVASVYFTGEGAVGTATLTIDNARKSAVDQATINVTKDVRIAIVQFNSSDNAVRNENVVFSLENEMVSKGFRVVDRSQLDTIRAEQRYQRSGEVDGRTAVDIGKFAGAKYIVTGSIDGLGSLRRFRLRVLDAETAEVVGVASVRY